jgi:hypothetical protein
MAEGLAKAFAGQEPKFFRLDKFGSLNTRANRPAIGDQEFSWIENMFPIGDGNMRCLPTNGPTLFTAPGGTTIIFGYCFNVAATPFAALFMSDGTATQVNLNTFGTTTITASAGTFFPGSVTLNNPAPDAAQWGTSGIVIVATAGANNYWAWDGTTLFAPGAASPSWLNGGTPTTMPNGVAGTCVEAFQGRAWIGNGANFTNSAPSNGADFAGADGGGTAAVTDSFLRREITALRQANSFLYRFGDSSVNVISNVQSSLSPVVTTYNNQNVDPQVGTPYHKSVAAYGRGLIFAHSTGVYRLEGGAAEKISDDGLDGILQNAAAALAGLSTVLQPSAAVCTIYAIKTYCLVIPAQDPLTGNIRTVMAMWAGGKKWFLSSQDRAVTFIMSQEVNSVLSAYGTDGTRFFQLFATTSGTLNKIIQTKLWAGDGYEITKQVMRGYAMAKDNSGSGYTITGTLDFVNENASSSIAVTITSSTIGLVFLGAGNVAIQFTGLGGANLNFTVSGLTLNGQNLPLRGALVGWTLQSTSPDFTLEALSLLYRNESPLGA